jgi:hypothetical protein
MPRLPKRLALVLGLLGVLASGTTPRAHAYALETSSWPKGTAASPTMEPLALHMQLVNPGPAFPSGGLQDGSTSWNQVVLNAIADWNQYISTLKLNGAISSQPPPTSQSASNHNDVLWDDTIYGESWGGTGTLGITLLIYDQNNVNVEVDILFNTTPGITWDSFRGPLQQVKSDLRRIALHELGHFLGLDHPDDANPPQNVAAIMNSVESNTDDLTPDDIAGGQFLYGAPNSNPVISTQPASQTVTQNSSVTFSVSAGGSGLTYQWQKNGVNIATATGSSFTINSAQVTDSGNYTVVVTNSTGSTTSNAAVLLVTAPPAFTLQPVSQTSVANGFSVVFTVAASGSPAPTFQWRLNGTPISGATDPVYFLAAAGSGNTGTYTCKATNSTGAATSNPATLQLVSGVNPGYLINLSARAAVGTGNNILIGGFGVGGSGSKHLLVRGVGPALSAFFPNYLANPQLVLLDNSGAVIATNIGWGNAPVAGGSSASEAPAMASMATMNRVGAYPYANGSADTAMVITMPTGNNTAQVSGVNGTSGIALAEIYDADTGTPAARLINISARADVGTGNNILIGGFAITGAASETVLLRAVGPGLNDTYPGVFPLSVVLNQPVLTLLNSSSGAVIASNTGWGGDANLASVSNAVGAFPLNAAHQDSVLLVTLPPGNYTAQVSGLNSGIGIALCEIYEVQ